MAKNSPWAMSSMDVFAAKMIEFVNATGGMMAIRLVRANDRELLRAVKSANRDAVKLVFMCAEALEDCRAHRGQEDARLCLRCAEPFHHETPVAFAMILPTLKVPESGPVIAMPICANCSSVGDCELVYGALRMIRCVMPNLEVMEDEFPDDD